MGRSVPIFEHILACMNATNLFGQALPHHDCSGYPVYDSRLILQNGNQLPCSASRKMGRQIAGKTEVTIIDETRLMLRIKSEDTFVYHLSLLRNRE